MLVLRRIFVSLLFVAPLPLFAWSQVLNPVNPPQKDSDRVYENSPAGLRWQLQDILNAARNHNRPKLEYLIRQMEIPNYQTWFISTFGAEQGKAWVAGYGSSLGDQEIGFADLINQLDDEDGEFVARRINDGPAPARHVEGVMVQALQRPVDIFFVTWKKRDSHPESDSVSIGYFAYVDGKFRWDSAITPLELQPSQATDNSLPETGPPPHSFGNQANPSGGKDRVISRPGADGIGYPSCDYCPDPAYTKLARKKRLEGTVVLSVIVEPDGSVTHIEVVKSPDPELTQMAVDGVSKWHLNPARRADGEPVPVIVPIEITFRLAR